MRKSVIIFDEIQKAPKVRGLIFLLSRGNKTCPVEVKSSGYKVHKSLDDLCKKYSDRIGSKYLIYTKDLKKDGDILFVPVYMTQFL